MLNTEGFVEIAFFAGIDTGATDLSEKTRFSVQHFGLVFARGLGRCGVVDRGKGQDKIGPPRQGGESYKVFI